MKMFMLMSSTLTVEMSRSCNCNCNMSLCGGHDYTEQNQGEVCTVEDLHVTMTLEYLKVCKVCKGNFNNILKLLI